MSSPIYVVESDNAAAARLEQILRERLHDVIAFPDTTGVIASAQSSPPSLFLISLQLKAASGLALCVSLRQHKTLSRVPIVFLSEQDSEDETVLGLDLGADDFIHAGIKPRELMARVNAVLRRSSPDRNMYKVQSGRVEVDTERCMLFVEGKRIESTTTQVRLMEYLIRNEGRVFSRDQILDAVWSDDAFVTPRTIDVHIRRIRMMIEPDPARPRYLRTVRGAGYCFVPQDKAKGTTFNPLGLNSEPAFPPVVRSPWDFPNKTTDAA